MKSAVAVLLAIALVLAWLLNAEVATNAQQRNQIAELTSKLGDKTARENLELQEKCALQAKKIYNDPLYKAEDRDKLGGPFQDYQSHYNAKLKKCFVTLQFHQSTPSGYATWSEGLSDAFERRDYATYLWIASEAKDKKNWMVQPFTCKLMHSSSNERECQSLEEYKAFVATYME